MALRNITVQTLSTTVGRARTGVRTSVVARIDRRVVDDRVVSTATIPFIRSRYISFVGRAFKPNTRLHVFFDDVNVNTYITPSSNVTVTPLSTKRFDYLTNADSYAEESDRSPRYISGNPQSSFNKGDIIYVAKRGFNTYTVSNSPGTAVLSYYGAGNVMYLNNVKGNILISDEVYGTISGANATIGANVAVGVQGQSLITNSNGDVSGVFLIPNTNAVRFRTGTRELVLTDNTSNDKILANTQGRVNYSATGTLTTRQATIAATRNAEVVRETVLDTDTIAVSSERITNDSGWYDPLAQTFLIDMKNGCFLTKVDIFFSTKDSTLPVTVEIRNTVNGYPGNKVLPFGRVTLNAEDVVTSTDALSATTFTFPSPIYVEEGAEYCIVLLSDSTDYRVWISQLGDDALGTDRRISQQPYAGVLFKSQNASTWTADQLQDLKFTLYRAQFDTANVGYLAYVNDAIPTQSLPAQAIQLKQNSKVVKVIHPNHGMSQGSNVTISGMDNNIITGYNVPAANINATHSAIGNVLLDSYTITIGNVASTTTAIATNNLKATRDVVFSVMQPIVEFRNFTGTSVVFKANTSPATFFATRSSTPVTVVANENNYFFTPQSIRSTVNETASSGTGRKSFELLAQMTTTVDNLSPVIDLNRSSLITVSNRIDNETSANIYKLHENSTIVSANTKIRFFGNSISTNEAVTANLLGTLQVGKSLWITNVGGNATNNANVIISKVTNASGIANVETYYSFVSENPGNAITLVQREGFVDERAYIGGTSLAKYVTRQINLTNPSKFLKIMFAANVPKTGEIVVYYRTLPVGSSDSLSTQNYVLATPTNAIIKSENPELYSDVEYEIDNIPHFSAVAIKIVLRSTNTSLVPSVKDLRVVACP